MNLGTFSPEPSTDGKGSHGGYAGPVIKPIGLHMVAEIACDAETAGLPLSGMGGIKTWRDAAEYIALGCGNVQVVHRRDGLRVPQELHGQGAHRPGCLHQVRRLLRGLRGQVPPVDRHPRRARLRGVRRRVRRLQPVCHACPAEDCITMESLPVGAIDPRTGEAVEGYANWTTHPNNPEVGAAWPQV